MYNPKSLELINFGSHKHTIYNFPERQTTLIKGANKTDPNQKSNGSGKSYIIDALAYALIGSPLRKVKDSELVFDGEKYAEIRFILYNPIKNHTLDIYRKIYSSTKSSELLIEGENNITSILEGNKLIIDNIGVGREDLLNYFLLSKERYTSFFSSSDIAKKELINRFSKADTIDIAIDSCQDDIKAHELEILSYERKIDANKAAIAAYKDSDSNDNIKLTQSISEENKSLQEAINSLDGQTDSTLLELLDSQELLEHAKNILSFHEPKLKEIKANIKEYQNLDDEIERHLNNKVSCPKCFHEFSLKDEKYNLEEAKSLYPIIQDNIADLVLEKQLKEKEYEEAANTIRMAQQDINELEFKIRKFVQEKKLKEHNIKINNERIENLNKPDNNGNAKKIAGFEKTNMDLKIKLDQAHKDLSNATEWQLRFKRFKGWIAGKSLKSIEHQANFYLQELGSTLSLFLDGYTPVKNGKEIREKIHTLVCRNGIEVGTFAKLSGGEKARLEVAIIMALQRIINQSANNSGINLLAIDEILDSCDSLGIESICLALNKLTANVLLISQIDVNINYENIICVEKIDGISKLSQ